MGNLRAIVERDLGETLEGDFGLHVELISPEGVIQSKNAHDEDQDLMGQVLYDHVVIDAETGMDMVIHEPVVTLRRSSLTEIPKCEPGKNWSIRIPESPLEDAPMLTYRIGRVPEGGATIGFVRLYCEQIEQEDE